MQDDPKQPFFTFAFVGGGGVEGTLSVGLEMLMKTSSCQGPHK